MIWGLFGALCLLSVLYLLWPWWRPSQMRERRGIQARQQLYYDQLQELEDEEGFGLLSKIETDRVRAETLRRLGSLNAFEIADRASIKDGAHNEDRGLAIAVALFLFLGSFGLYAVLGAPAISTPSRAEQDAARHELMQLTQSLMTYLEAKPEEVGAWDALGRALVLLGRSAEAKDSYMRGMQAAGRQPTLLIGWVEAEMAEAGGAITPSAWAAVEEVLTKVPDHPVGLYYLGLRSFEEGDPGRALTLWHPLLGRVPADWPLRGNLERAIQAAEAMVAK